MQENYRISRLGCRSLHMSSALFKNRRLAMAALTALVAIGMIAWRSLGASQPRPTAAVPTVPVSIASVERRDVAHLVTGIGNVQSLHSVVLRPQVSGIVTEILFEEGRSVRKGEVLARIDDRAIIAALQQAQAQRARNDALLKAAELDLTRYANLRQQKLIPQQTLEQQHASVDQLRAAILGDDAAIAAAQVQLSHTRMTSPIDGRAGLRRIDAGNLVQAGDQAGLVTVTQLDPISVVFTLPQDLLPRVQPLLQNAAAAEVLAFERDGGLRLAEGRLTMIDNQIDAATGTIRLRARFANPQGALWPGQFVTVQLQTSVSGNATVVPARSVQEGLNGSFVFRVRGGKVDAVPVTVAYREAEIAVIRDGVTPGEVIVTDGQSRLKPGTAVEAASEPARVAETT